MLWKILGVIVVLVVLIGGYHAYQQHKNAEARKAIVKVCNSKPPLAGIYTDYQIEAVDAHKKIVNFQMNEELSNELKSNLNSYIDDHISVAKRFLGQEHQSEDTQGNLAITGDSVQPLCYAIASNKTFVKKWGKGWIVNIYNAQGKLVYQYQDDKFLEKPEIEVEPAIEKAAQEHDENAARITASIFNAIGRNSD